MKNEDLAALFSEFERQAIEEAKEAAELRKNAHGILKTNSFEKRIAKNQDIVLAYGMTQEVFSPADLKQFLDVMAKRQKRFNPDPGLHGVPYASLLRASRQVDKQRAKLVRNATLYQRKDNIFYFQVTGNSKSYYRVQIRLEEWGSYLIGSVPVIEAARRIVKGRISFECPCGRHQYWYRFLATLGQYALAPKETGFPKIRNPQLMGCCCKHVLKVLDELTSNRIVLILAKELQREREKVGFSGSVRKRILSPEDIRLAQAKRLTRDAMAAFTQYEKEAEELKKKMTPRNGKKIKASKTLINGLKTILDVAKLNPRLKKPMLDGFAKTHNLTREDVDKIIMEHNL